jgi:hypothetical protein
MKMTSVVFLGSFLVVMGLVIILNVIFKVDIPVFRILIAFVFLFIGIKILLGKHMNVFGHNTAQINNTSINQPGSQEYNIVFSKNIVDLRDTSFTDNKPVRTHVNVVFGHCEIFLSKDIPFRITSNTAFANIKQPDGNTVVVGSTKNQSKDLDESKPFIDLKIDAVFAEVSLVFY